MAHANLTRSRIKQLASLLTAPIGFPGLPPRSDIRNQLKQALRAMPLESLDTNPLAVEIPASRGESLMTWTPVRVLSELGDFSWVPNDEGPLLRDSILHCIRPRSGFILDWLELLLPQNGHLTHVCFLMSGI